MTLREGKEIYSYHAKAKGEVKGKCADADIQLDVDQMMLDYLLYMSTKALLEERIGPRDGNLTEPPPELLTGINTCKQSSSDLLLGMVDGALTSFTFHRMIVSTKSFNNSQPFYPSSNHITPHMFLPSASSVVYTS